MKQQTFTLGSDIKLRVTLTELGEGISLDNCEFSLKFTSGARSKTYNVTTNGSNTSYPAGVARIDANSVRVAIPTEDLDRGDLWLEATVHIADSDFPDNERTEIIRHNTGITLE